MKNKIAIALMIANDVKVEHKGLLCSGILKKPSETDGWVILDTPQDLMESTYQSLAQSRPELERSPNSSHISVMNDEELNEVGLDNITEFGEKFNFTVEGIDSVDPEGWDDMERVFFIRCKSPELETFRKKYDLSPLMNKDHDFHITVGTIPKPSKVEKVAKTNWDKITGYNFDEKVIEDSRILPSLAEKVLSVSDDAWQEVHDKGLDGEEFKEEYIKTIQEKSGVSENVVKQVVLSLSRVGSVKDKIAKIANKIAGGWNSGWETIYLEKPKYGMIPILENKMALFGGWLTEENIREHIIKIIEQKFTVEPGDRIVVHGYKDRGSKSETPDVDWGIDIYGNPRRIAIALMIAKNKLDKEFFNYPDHIKEIWNDLFTNANKEYNIVFNRENDYPIKQRKIKFDNPRTNNDIWPSYKFDCELWAAGGDWEYPTYYFRCQAKGKRTPSMMDVFGSDSLFVFYPSKEEGNLHLIKGKNTKDETIWSPPHNSEVAEKDVPEKDEKKCWEALNKYLQGLIKKDVDAHKEAAKARPTTLFEQAIFDVKTKVKGMKENLTQKTIPYLTNKLKTDLATQGFQGTVDIKLGKFRGSPFVTSSKLYVSANPPFKGETDSRLILLLNHLKANYSPKFKFKSLTDGVAFFNIR